MKLTLFTRILLTTIFKVLFCSFSTAQFAKETYDYKEIGPKGLTEIQFVGTGDLQVAVEEKKDIVASTGLGAIFWRIWPNNQFNSDIQQGIWDENPEWRSGSKKNLMSGLELQLEVKINVASTMDTIFARYNNNNIVNSRSFGSYTLAPLSSGPSTTVNSVWYFKPRYFNDKTGVTHRAISFKGFILKNIDGAELGFTAANQVWHLNTDTVKNVSVHS